MVFELRYNSRDSRPLENPAATPSRILAWMELSIGQPTCWCASHSAEFVVLGRA
ncbi:hypothetical protein [Lentzea indica]|uniref:hypothetical protein n=1 Tax=Lentzea indica TaxID=2604800 RepID=UPI001FEC13D6|nr:hypothetical protein [Lentzea indica]